MYVHNTLKKCFKVGEEASSNLVFICHEAQCFATYMTSEAASFYWPLNNCLGLLVWFVPRTLDFTDNKSVTQLTLAKQRRLITLLAAKFIFQLIGLC